MPWNRKLLKQDIANDARNLKTLKAKMHEPYQPHFGWQERRDLADLKRRATVHHAAAAHLNNKIHLSNWQPEEGDKRPMTREEQQELIKKILPQYFIQETVAA
jgi:hypothetical protein